MSLRRQIVRLAATHPAGSWERQALVSIVAWRPELVPVTDDDIRYVRTMARTIARKHGIRIQVRKGKNSIRGSVSLHSRRPDPLTIDARVEVIDALVAAGYEDSVGAATLQESRQLATEWGHTHISLTVAKTTQ
jgi:hypothetical protein